MQKYSGCLTVLVCMVALLFAVAFVHSCFAQPAQVPAPPVPVTRHLDSITLHQYTLDWTVVDSEGKKYEYHIDLQAAEMTVNGEHRNFDKSEAEMVSRASNWLARYCIESVKWWEAKDDEEQEQDKDTAKPETKQSVSLR